MNLRMKYKFLSCLPGIILFFLFISCSPEHRKKRITHPHRQVTEETLIHTNQYLVEKDKERIRQYIKRHGWHMQETGTGLWYGIYHHGNGPKVTSGKTVTIRYTVSLLDGTVCYSSDNSGPKTFIAGHGGVPAGLEQGIRMLRLHDKAHFILPPLLAYGIPGDYNKIPPRSVIVYDMEIIDIK